MPSQHHFHLRQTQWQAEVPGKAWVRCVTAEELRLFLGLESRNSGVSKLISHMEMRVREYSLEKGGFMQRRKGAQMPSSGS